MPNTIDSLHQPAAEERREATGAHLEALVREWLADLQIQGRSEQTIDWYRRNVNGHLRGGAPGRSPRAT